MKTDNMPGTKFAVRRYDISPVPLYLDTSCSFFFVLLEGELTLRYDSYEPLTVHAGECVMAMPESCYSIVVHKPSLCLRIFNSEQLAESYRGVLAESGEESPKDVEYEFRALPSPEALMQFLRSVCTAIEDGRSTPGLQTKWSATLAELLALYYTPRQLASFMRPLMATDYNFRNLVIEHSLHVKDLQELASMCRMSLSTFKRRFKRTFNVPAHTWIAARRAHFIYSEITGTRKTFMEIAEQFNISSSAYLTAFCKHHFGMTPLEIRRRDFLFNGHVMREQAMN